LSAATDFTDFVALAATAVLAATAGVAGLADEAAAAALTVSGLVLTADDPGGAEAVVFALTEAASALTALADALTAATGAFDAAFTGKGEAFASDFADVAAEAVVFGVDPCERGDEIFVAALAGFASFFEDAILIAP
jgi:hypothetical protein